MLKYAKTILEKGIQQEPSLKTTSTFENRASSHEVGHHTPTYLLEEPETIIGEQVTIKGAVSFEKLLRVDGTFEGQIDSQGEIIIGPKGFVKANLDLKSAFIAGKVEGNITVKERVVLRARAEIRGDITAPLLSIDEGVSIIGRVHVTAPEQLPETL